MYRYAVRDLEELAHQLTLSPRRLRATQIAGIEKLLDIVERDRPYPYDLVCFHITGYRPNTVNSKTQRAPIAGRLLMGDLIVMAEHISRKASLSVDEVPDVWQTQDELATKLHVSTKTIRRWRPRGLMGVRLLGEDGVSRLLFCKNTVDRFVRQNSELIERGASFNQLSSAEKRHLVERAREILAGERLKLHAVSRILAEESGRAIETIRYTLRAHDRANADEALFDLQGRPRLSSRHLAIWESHQAGQSVAAIAKSQRLTQKAVKTIVREIKARTLLAAPIHYVDNELFSAPDADHWILDVERPAASAPTSRPRIPKDLPAYLRAMYQVPLLSREQEQDLFRRYNYLKYKAASRLADLDPCETTDQDLALIEDLLARVRAIKNEIVQANLRLVVSIAKRHVGSSADFFEVVSDGNMSLMRAVENFDFARGNKFSTYASWAIMKNYARTIPEEHYHFCRYMTGQDEVLESSPDRSDPELPDLDSDQVRSVLAEGLETLDERERTILTGHYGLFGRGGVQTLEELGKRFGVTKERIRQIEVRAINKLRDVLAPSAADFINP